MGWFKRKKSSVNTEELTVRKIKSKQLDYHPKIIMAWTKAIEGNLEFTTYLQKNGFKELAIAVLAIKLDEKARSWLMFNGYPHLMAMINSAEGNEKAKTWLEVNNFQILYNIAEAVDGEHEGKNGFLWLRQNATPDLFILAQAIKTVKDEIEERHNDVHKIG